jgi:micrococcal nuclease
MLYTYCVDILGSFPYSRPISSLNLDGYSMRIKPFLIRAIFALIILAGLITFLLSSISFAREPIRTVTGTVTKVSDGDTIHVTTPEQTKLKVRLYGMDAPETSNINRRTGRVSKPGQPYGEESWKALGAKILGSHVRLDIIDRDRYKRMVGLIWIGDRNINIEMIREGYAEAYVEYLKEPYRSEFMRAELEARSAKRGIWSLPDYERPRDFKKRLKMR